MKITKLTLNNFRNYEHAFVEFFDGLNIIEGRNAQGKTNLLEAVFYCSIGKSLRASREREVIKFGETFARVKVEVQKEFRKTEIYLLFSRLAKKTVKIDGIPIRKIGELLGELNAVYFSPDELRLIKDAPEDRRRFMDIHISQTSKQYFYLLGRYEKILANRNRLLKDTKDVETLKETLPIWDTQLVDIGAKIITQRVKFIQNLLPYAQKAHTYLTKNAEELTLEYSTDIPIFEQNSTTNTTKNQQSTQITTNDQQSTISLQNLQNPTAISNTLQNSTIVDTEKIKKSLETRLEKTVEKDIKMGYTTTGPHRDDIKISVNGVDIRSYGSQGQQRTVALSLKLAELEIMHAETGEIPILILDDVLSELDVSRRERLLNFCAKTQTFISGTDFPFVPNAHYFEVVDGKIKLK